MSFFLQGIIPMTILKKICSILFLLTLGVTIYAVFPFSKKNYYNPGKTKVVIIGATSGIGKDIAKEFAHRGYTAAITGRRAQLLEEIKKEIGSTEYSRARDIPQSQQARDARKELRTEMRG